MKRKCVRARLASGRLILFTGQRNSSYCHRNDRLYANQSGVVNMMKGRKMKFKHALLAAGLLAAATSANAAIDTDNAGASGGGDGSGELFVSVFRNVPGQQQSYLIDTGITASQLLSGS